MLTDTPIVALRRLALLFGALLLAFLGLFSAHTWRSVKSDQIRELQTVLALAERTLSGHLRAVRVGDCICSRHRSSKVLVCTIGPAHSGSCSATRRSTPGSIRSTSSGSTGRYWPTQTVSRPKACPPWPANLRSPNSYSSIGPATRTELSRPLLGVITKTWLFGLRYVMRDASGQPVAVLSRVIPVDATDATVERRARAREGMDRPDARRRVPHQPPPRARKHRPGRNVRPATQGCPAPAPARGRLSPAGLCRGPCPSRRGGQRQCLPPPPGTTR